MTKTELQIFEQNTFLSKIAKRLISNSKPSQKDFYVREKKEDGQQDIEISFRTRGCQHFLYGGCSMCNYGFGPDLTIDQLFSNAKRAIESIDEIKNANLFLSPFGSMLDPWEVPIEAQNKIFAFVAQLPISSYYFESEAKFITKSNLQRLRSLCIDLPITIGIGLESSNQWILENIINKRLPVEEFRTALRNCKLFNCCSVANIILGVPFLTENECIEDAISSIKWAINEGIDKCYLFPINVKKGTITYWLWENGYYYPSSLWSLIEVLVRLENLSERVSFAWHKMYYKNDRVLENKYIAFPDTCPKCYNKIVASLDDFLLNRDYRILNALENFDCVCKKAWREKLVVGSPLSLEERIISMYTVMGKEILGQAWWKQYGHLVIEKIL